LEGLMWRYRDMSGMKVLKADYTILRCAICTG
jgi:hypothetical protein